MIIFQKLEQYRNHVIEHTFFNLYLDTRQGIVVIGTHFFRIILWWGTTKFYLAHFCSSHVNLISKNLSLLSQDRALLPLLRRLINIIKRFHKWNFFANNVLTSSTSFRQLIHTKCFVEEQIFPFFQKYIIVLFLFSIKFYLIC